MRRAWTRQEMLVVLDHYFAGGPFTIGNREVENLARLLGRTPDTIVIRLMNFRNRDPEARAKGLVGMRGGGEHVQEIWNEFAENRAGLRTIAAVHLSEFEAEDNSRLLNSLLDDAEDEFPEGRSVLLSHVRRERSRKLVNEAKRRFEKEHGRLYCEVCGFEFKRTYGPLGEGFIEAHHNVPVSELTSAGTTKVKDLSLVCANCHRMLHRRRPWLTVSELRKALML